MNNTKYSYTFDSDRIFPHEIAALCRCESELFFPTAFYRTDGLLTAIYDCTGYRPLSEFKIEHTNDVMYVLEKILLILQQSQEYLFVPDRILLSPKTIFYRQDDGNVRIAFVPPDGRESDLHRNILKFLIGIKGDLCDSFQPYLYQFAQASSRENMNIDEMLTLVGLLRREIDMKLREIA